MLGFKKKLDFTIPEGGINTIERLSINGIEQTILTHVPSRRRQGNREIHNCSC